MASNTISLVGRNYSRRRDLPKFDSTCGVKQGVYLVLVFRCYCQDIAHHLLTVYVVPCRVKRSHHAVKLGTRHAHAMQTRRNEQFISIAWCKTEVKPVLTHWGYRMQSCTKPSISWRMYTFVLHPVLLCFGSGRFYPYPPGLHHWHWGKPASTKQPRKLWIMIRLIDPNLMIYVQQNSAQHHYVYNTWTTLHEFATVCL